MTSHKLYLISSLRNPIVPEIHVKLEKIGFDVFSSWFSPGPRADDYWRDYTKDKGLDLKGALLDPSAEHIYAFDHYYLDNADLGVLLMPAGKSCHLELGYLIGKGKPGYIVYNEVPKRYDIMIKFCNDIFFGIDEMIAGLQKARKKGYPKNLAFATYKDR